MPFRPDILIRASDGQSIAVVEVKNRQNLTRDLAITLRRNLIVHAFFLPTPFFLLISQDVGFLWKGREQNEPYVPPICEFPLTDVLSRYLPALKEGERLRETELELVLLQWLTDLTSISGVVQEPEKSLELCGFLEAIRGAKVIAEAKQ